MQHALGVVQKGAWPVQSLFFNVLVYGSVLSGFPKPENCDIMIGYGVPRLVFIDNIEVVKLHVLIEQYEVQWGVMTHVARPCDHKQSNNWLGRA